MNPAVHGDITTDGAGELATRLDGWQPRQLRSRVVHVPQNRQEAEDVRALSPSDAVATATDRLRDGSPVMLQDDRRDIAYLLTTSQHCDADAINAMARMARGLICLALTADHCDRLGLTELRRDESAYPAPRRAQPEVDHLPFTRSIEARHGVTTGISTADRARTIAVAAAPEATADDVVVPGHVFPLRARRSRHDERAGVAEAAITLAELAGSPPAAVICAVLDDDGDVARGANLAAILARFELPLVTTSQLKVGSR